MNNFNPTQYLFRISTSGKKSGENDHPYCTLIESLDLPFTFPQKNAAGCTRFRCIDGNSACLITVHGEKPVDLQGKQKPFAGTIRREVILR